MLNLELIIDSLDDVEKIYYSSKYTNTFYDFFVKQEKYKKILNKMVDDSLNEEDWDYIISRLYIILCKAITEEKEISFFEKISYRFSDFCLTHFDEHYPLYQECFKIKKFIEGYEMLKSLNMDLADGLHILIEDKTIDNLSLLLEQNELAALFRDYNKSFFDEYVEDKSPDVSPREYYNINMSERNYVAAKKLMLKYNSNNTCNK